MAKSLDKLAKEIHELPDVEKLRLVDEILTDLDKPDPEIDRIGGRRRACAGLLTKPARSRPFLMSSYERKEVDVADSSASR